jgi:glycolate oxidase
VSEPAWLAVLREGLGDRLRTSDVERRLYSYDATGLRRGLPAAVVHPEGQEDLVFLVQQAAAHGFALVPRGSGTGLSGGAVPYEGNVVVSFERMRRVLSLDVRQRRLSVESGVVNGRLDALLAPYGLFYPPDPASFQVSSIGGNIAENAGGPHAVKYGITGQRVLGLEVVDASGRAGRLVAGCLQDGPDLVSLVVGSEGTLAFVVSAELALAPRPREVVTMLASFGSVGEATDFVSDVVAAGLLPSTLEFLDRNTIVAVEQWGVAHYPEGAQAVLLLEFDGEEDEVAEEAEACRRIALAHRSLAFQIARDEEERQGLWLGRRGSYAARAHHGRRILTQDVVVPRQSLTLMLQEVERIAQHYNLLVVTAGHAGDGNLHPDFPYDPDDELLARRVHAANDEVIEACVRLGGSITGEHGIGIEKLHQLSMMYGPAELGLMAAVKRALDPIGILNPGKAVPLVEREEPEGVPAHHAVPKTAEELQASVLAARADARPLAVSLRGFDGVVLDLPNLTVQVGAGLPIADALTALAETKLTFPIAPLLAETFAEAVLWNDYGPEHWSVGTLRTLLLAAGYVTGRGERVEMGRAIVKNVAGYDLFRLLIGSLGRLAVPYSFTFRLQPRRPERWYRRRIRLEGELPEEAYHAGAVFLLPEAEGATLYLRAARRPGEGYADAPEAEEELALLRRQLRGQDDLLDLAFPPKALSSVLASLPRPPRVVLPLAARLLVTADPEEAKALAGQVGGDGGPGRALYGARRRRLATPAALQAAWEEALEKVFDPDGILRTWFPPTEGEVR